MIRNEKKTDILEDSHRFSGHSPDNHETVSVEKATFWRRWLAFTIDMVILSLVDGFISQLGGTETTPTWWEVALVIIGIVIPAIYFIWAYSAGGQTFGKAILGVKVISIDGSPLDWRKGILRSVGYILSSIPLNLGFLWSIWDADKQAWHDKVAGTCVVRSSVTREQLQGTIDPLEARRRQKRWLIGLGIPFILIVVSGGVWFFSLLQSGMAEVRDMGPWPGPEVSPREAVTVDLAHLGLHVGQILNAREVETWAGGQYNEGIMVTYEVGKNTVVGIVGVRYDDIDIAGNDFNIMVASAEESCQVFTQANFSGTGVIHCRGSDYFQKIFMNDYWIVSIHATQEVLVDAVRDAFAIHWEGISQP